MTIKTYEFEHIKDIELPVDNFYKSVFGGRFLKNDSEFYFINFSKKHLFLFDLNKKEIISDIFLPKTREVTIVNTDTIFLIQRDNPNFSYRDEDSMLLLIDITGKIKKNYSLKNVPVLGGLYNSADSAAIIDKIKYKNNRLYLFMSKLLNVKYLNDSSWRSVQNPILGYIDLSNDNFYSIPINYPDLPEDKLIDKSYAQFFAYITDQDIFCSFAYTPKILKYNFRSKKVDTILAKSYFLNDTFFGSKETTYLIDPPSHLPFNYCEQYNEYISYYALSSILKNKPSNGVILDSNFNRIGEYISKIWISDKNYIDGYYYVYNKKRTMNSDKKLVISVYKLNSKNIPIDSLAQSLDISETEDNCNIPNMNNFVDSAYLENYLVQKTGDTNFKAIIIPIFMSCHSCVDFLLQTYTLNQENYRKNKVYLIAVGEDFMAIKEKLSNFNIFVDGKYVILDSASHYVDAYKEFSMEHLAIIKNKRLVFAKDYYPDELDELVKKTFE
jgi:hypothetical protein